MSYRSGENLIPRAAEFLLLLNNIASNCSSSIGFRSFPLEVNTIHIPVNDIGSTWLTWNVCNNGSWHLMRFYIQKINLTALLAREVNRIWHIQVEKLKRIASFNYHSCFLTFRTVYKIMKCWNINTQIFYVMMTKFSSFSDNFTE